MPDINNEIVKLLQSKISISHGELNSAPQNLVGLDEAADAIFSTVTKAILAREMALLKTLEVNPAVKAKADRMLEDVSSTFNEFCQEATNEEVLNRVLLLYKDLKNGSINIEVFMREMDLIQGVNSEPEACTTPAVVEPAMVDEPQYSKLVSVNGYDTFSFDFKKEGATVKIPYSKVKKLVETDKFLSFCYNRMDETEEFEKVKSLYYQYIDGVESYHNELI
jgi:hypothetical protein